MPRPRFHYTAIFISLIFLWTFPASNRTVVLAQEPTATSAPQATGAYITVITDEPQINVRLGPSSTIYPIVGTLPTGSVVPALGRSAGGDWVQIEFPSAPNGKGWVYSPLVQVTGTLQIAEPPPTPVPPATATIDPTLEAQFTILPTATRLPTFTPPPTLIHPVYTQAPGPAIAEAVSPAALILSLGSLGVIGFFLSLIIKRR